MPYVSCFTRTILYAYIEYCISVNMYHVSAQGVDERMIKVHYFHDYDDDDDDSGGGGGGDDDDDGGGGGGDDDDDDDDDAVWC